MNKVVTLLFFLCALQLIFFSCAALEKIKEMPIKENDAVVDAPLPSQPLQKKPSYTGISGEVRTLVETGSKESLLEAIAVIKKKKIGGTEFGREMSAVAVTLLDNIYGLDVRELPKPDPPLSSKYAKILKNAAQGLYTQPSFLSQDYIEFVLPSLALLNNNKNIHISDVQSDLLKARTLNNSGVLAVYFLGVAFENLKNEDAALDAYNAAQSLDGHCYPARLGISRILQLQNKSKEAVALLEELNGEYTDNPLIQRQLANAYYNDKDWTAAYRILNNALNNVQDDNELMLMQARVQIENKRYLQAQTVLDNYKKSGTDSRDFRFISARLQNEGFKNKDEALNLLRVMIKNDPNDYEVIIYTTKILLQSKDENDLKQGREFLVSLLNKDMNDEGGVPLDVVELAVEDAIKREAWLDAQRLQEKILPLRRNNDDILNSYFIENGMGNKTAALNFAKELYESGTDNEEAPIAYAAALIGVGRTTEALKIIDNRIAALGSGAYKSRYYYLRSRMKNSVDASIADLRSSLFENPRNLDALKAMFDIYRRRSDNTRAIYYLRQALALAPRDPELIKYQAQFIEQ
ncbi:hypothetical protein AGMMS50212_13400 [Spirochaetia bacterium]|nr:hypothetical protein AGMMS50212_13400 [Spirochaetia bacterium]